ncbi:hypothetical protein [Chryseosolibacter indicus]|uniref:YtxH domain-containing protein n=1 Tax=Chryseosolibacter indicus TaxID=2782351 RepID=A0ABS5VT41_9BACT|nr:hypothetical protein [Chryseosolibacter indicus]MBT1704608.1 hypothetical protein [Chryseosolibacter indicus]
MAQKKSKKKGKKALKAFFKSNKVALAALGGALAGITLSNTLGSEKAREIIQTVENSLATISDKVKNGINAGSAHEKKHASVS